MLIDNEPLYLYHNTNNVNLRDIILTGQLQPATTVKRQEFTPNGAFLPYIFMKCGTHKDSNMNSPYSLVFFSSILHYTIFGINEFESRGSITKTTKMFAKGTPFTTIDKELRLTINKHVMAQAMHEIFIVHPVSLTKAIYIIIPKHEKYLIQLAQTKLKHVIIRTTNHTYFPPLLEPYIKVTGGSKDKYYNKYLKYKNKYLKLKLI